MIICSGGNDTSKFCAMCVIHSTQLTQQGDSLPAALFTHRTVALGQKKRNTLKQFLTKHAIALIDSRHLVICIITYTITTTINRCTCHIRLEVLEHV